MAEASESYRYETKERSHSVRIATECDTFAVGGFRHRGGPPDPAGLCDGGDYIRELRISRNNDGTVRVSWRVAEWYVKLGTPKRDFFDADYPALFDVLWPHLAQVKAELHAAGKLR